MAMLNMSRLSEILRDIIDLRRDYVKAVDKRCELMDEFDDNLKRGNGKLTDDEFEFMGLNKALDPK